MSAVATGSALIIRMSTASGAAFAGPRHLRRERRFHDDRDDHASVELCRRSAERLGFWDPHLGGGCRRLGGELLARTGGALLGRRHGRDPGGADTRRSFAQDNLSTDCDADRRHAGHRSEQRPQRPTFVPKGADLYQTAAMRSGMTKSTLLSGPVPDGGLEGNVAARGECPTPASPFLCPIRNRQSRGPFLSEASEQPNGGQLIQGVEAMADVTSSDRCRAATSDTAQFPLTGVALSAAREAVP
jgi:hypothetical protein